MEHDWQRKDQMIEVLTQTQIDRVAQAITRHYLTLAYGSYEQILREGFTEQERAAIVAEDEKAAAAGLRLRLRLRQALRLHLRNRSSERQSWRNLGALG
jgi:hypothetical protein